MLALCINPAAALGSLERLQNRGRGESISFLVDIDEVCLISSAQASDDGLHGDCSTYKHAQSRDERDDLAQPPKGEEDVSQHGNVLSRGR